jgi:hypothetical protein
MFFSFSLGIFLCPLCVSFTVYVLLLFALKKQSFSVQPCTINKAEVESYGGIYIGGSQFESGRSSLINLDKNGLNLKYI